MAYTNSSLVVYTKLSPNHSGQRTHDIDRITPHCIVGYATAEGLGDWFSKSERQASSNYGIDKDGRVGMYVEEKNRSWCSSSNANDQRAITIECASDTKEPYSFPDATYKMLIKLCIDICKRNGKKKLLWLGDRDMTLNYSPKSDEMVLTVHRWFANKSCPGNWLMARMDELASKVTAGLSGSDNQPVETPTSSAADNEKFIWDYLYGRLNNAYAVAGIMGNAFAESGFKPTNLQNSFEKKLGMDDLTYTAAVDSGAYGNFVKDSAGYGLVQWTYWSRKQDLLDFAKAQGKSIGDLSMQLDFLWKELSESYKGLLTTLKAAKSVREASDAVLTQYERPADQGETAQERRASYGQGYYDKYAATSKQELYRVRKTWADSKTQKGAYKVLKNARKCADENPGYKVFDSEGIIIYASASSTEASPVKTDVPFLVQVKISTLNIRQGAGTDTARVRYIEPGTYTIVAVQSGPGSKTGWGKLKSGIGFISLDYAVRL